ncbi:tyrosine-type recombinase/integrase [Sutcliffiella sp. NC1]|uniref:tyrosine-type recombinase/integrase n=1 Tax=Sutcliffiella sp. NC1 TaxID=3004096 RepID=UPI0022DD7489|nr:tyrosine-type recombinase/integrase [Sutcliffiella sp. NC1]WBL15108.1 tyrosine-type recombinase/integrase [Sutcliffiella sp. NC1]
MKIEKTLTSIVLVDSKMRIIPEVLDFTNYLNGKEYSPNTIRSYVRDLKVFYEWMEIGELEVFEVQPRHMTSFIAHIDSKSPKGRVSPATLNRYLATLSSFYEYFEVIGGFTIDSTYKKRKNFFNDANRGYLRHVVKDWNSSVYSFFSRKKHKKIDKKRLYQHEAKKFYDVIGELYSDNESLKVRNQLIFKVLYETGMRIGELLHLRVSDYDLPDPFSKTGNIYLVFREEDEEDLDRRLKTGERVIAVSNALLKEIDEYVMFHRPMKEGCEYIFVTHSSGESEGEPPSRASMEKWFRKVYVASDLYRNKVTPHALRHTHVTNLIEAGIDINIVKERVGHGNINTTDKYTHISHETLSTSYERFLTQYKGGEL